MTLESWKSGEPLAATKLNQPVDAINKMPPPPPPTAYGDGGRQFRIGKIIAATATSTVDANTNPVQWYYELHECYKGSTGYGGWRALPEGAGYRGIAYSFCEDGNDGTGRQMNGIDHDGAGYPAGFEMQPLQVNQIVLFTVVFAPKGDGTHQPEAWIFTVPNGEDGTCT